jgi:hypothetical protein
VKEKSNRRRWVIAGVLAALALLNVYLRRGDSNSSALPTAATRGVVMYRGQPLNGGQIRFISRDPANKVGQARGMIGRDGTYAFAGAPVGPVTVTVNTSVRLPEDYFWRPGSQSPKPIYVPAKYADATKSGIQLDLQEGVQEYNIQLD